jgi:uracil phosphoribosyltransferase
MNFDHSEADETGYLSLLISAHKPSKYEEVLMTQLRDRHSGIQEVRKITEKIGEQLVVKVVEALPTQDVQVETPVAMTSGKVISTQIELLSIMRSGDTLLDTFFRHFPDANLSKLLIQRNEETAEPEFKYMKLTSTLAAGAYVVITEPMIATGGTLKMAISLLKERGVAEDKIIIAALCAAPEGLKELYKHYPKIKVAVIALDEKLNEKKYIVPGLGDFGDRYFGTLP